MNKAGFPLSNLVLSRQQPPTIEQLKQSFRELHDRNIPLHVKIALAEGIKAQLKNKLKNKKKQIAVRRIEHDKTSQIRKMASIVCADSNKYLDIMEEYLKYKKDKKNGKEGIRKLVNAAKTIRNRTKEISMNFQKILETQQEERQIRLIMLTQLKMQKAPAKNKGQTMALTFEEMYEGQDKENRNSLLMNR